MKGRGRAWRQAGRRQRQAELIRHDPAEDNPGELLNLSYAENEPGSAGVIG